MTQNLFFLDPALTPGQPIATLCSALDPAALMLSQWQALQNVRTDKLGAITVRSGSALLSSAPVSGAGITVGACLGLWSGLLDGTRYLISAHVVTEAAATAVRIFSYNLTTFVATELTSLAGWSGASGNSRLSNTTNSVNFGVVRLGRGYFVGAIKPARDVLVIQNGIDDPRIYDPRYHTGAYIDPGQPLQVHTKIIVPSGAGQVRKTYRLTNYLQVANATGTGRVYTNSGVTLTMAETTVAPYANASNYCIKITGTNMAAAATCNTKFSASASFPGEQLVAIVEGPLAQVQRILDNCKLEFNASSAVYASINTGTNPWQTVYDPSATSHDAQKRKYDIVTFDATSNRHLVVFYGLASIDSTLRTAFHVRLTRTTATAATTTDSMILLMLAGASTNAYIAGTDFAVAYSDPGSQAESPSYVCSSSLGDTLVNMGGPDTGLSFPNLGLIGLPLLLDYSIWAKNTDAATQITGGLNGTPMIIDVYAAYPLSDPVSGQTVGLSEYFWINDYIVWVPGLGGGGASIWAQSVDSATHPFIEILTSSFAFISGLPARSQRDPRKPRPTAFNERMPTGQCIAFANDRSFVGNLYEGGVTAPGDVAFSTQGHPFRYQAVSEDDFSGGRAQIGGDTVQAIVPLSAGSSAYNPNAGTPVGSARVFVVGTIGLYSLGRSDAWSGQFYSDSVSLSRPALIGPHGTTEPGSVATYANQLFFLDQESQIMEFTAQGLASISRNKIDDQMKAVPAARRGHAQAVYFRDRYLLGFTASAGTLNTRLAGFANLFGYWEFNDLLPGSIDAERMVRLSDSSQVGSGQRLVMGAKTGGAIYAYEEGTLEYDGSKVAVTLTTRAVEFWRLFKSEIGKGGIFQHVGMLSDSVASATLTVDRYYQPNGTQFRSSQALDNPAVAGGMRLGDDTNATVTEVTATGAAEGGAQGYLSLSASMTGGTRIKAIWAEITDQSNGEVVGSS